MLDVLDSFDTLAELQRSFQASKSGLIRKKLKLYEEGNMTKWGLNESITQKP
jgi:ribosomal protein L21E